MVSGDGVEAGAATLGQGGSMGERRQGSGA